MSWMQSARCQSARPGSWHLAADPAQAFFLNPTAWGAPCRLLLQEGQQRSSGASPKAGLPSCSPHDGDVGTSSPDGPQTSSRPLSCRQRAGGPGTCREGPSILHACGGQGGGIPTATPVPANGCFTARH